MKKGMKGFHPDFSGVLGREGLINTHHSTCWVCEKRKYVLLTVQMDPANKNKFYEKWGNPITNYREKIMLKNKYLSHCQMPGNLNDQPILISSINDWFPIHMMPVVQFAMMMDYTLMSDISRETSVKIDSKDSVTKFKTGYDAILNDVIAVERLEMSMKYIY